MRRKRKTDKVRFRDVRRRLGLRSCWCVEVRQRKYVAPPGEKTSLYGARVSPRAKATEADEARGVTQADLDAQRRRVPLKRRHSLKTGLSPLVAPYTSHLGETGWGVATGLGRRQEGERAPSLQERRIRAEANLRGLASGNWRHHGDAAGRIAPDGLIRGKTCMQPLG